MWLLLYPVSKAQGNDVSQNAGGRAGAEFREEHAATVLHELPDSVPDLGLFPLPLWKSELHITFSSLCLLPEDRNPALRAR